MNGLQSLISPPFDNDVYWWDVEGVKWLMKAGTSEFILIDEGDE